MYVGDTINTTNPLLNLSDELLQSTIEAARSPLIVTDNSLPDNPIIYSNQAFLDLCGYTLEEILGRNCRFLQGDDSDEEAVKTLHDAVKSGTSARVTLKNYKKDGTVFWNDLVMSPVKDKAGKTTHFMGMQLDITDRIESQRSLLLKSQQLEQSNHELEQFTYATSHDLQEPLRMINSYLQLLQKRYGEQFDEDALTFLHFATEGADRMQDLINSLLVLSRVSNDTNRYKLIAMDTVIDKAIANLKLAIEDTKADIHIETMPEMCIDPIQMTQLFQNLIGNALKYHDKQVAPRVTISARRVGDAYEFTVADNGIGIDKQHFDRIFTIFQRLHTRSEYPGTGVGLAICSKIVDRHGGKIWVESEENKGSQFKFSIPMKRDQ